MSYNTQLQTNNTKIQSLIDTVNALPDAPAAVEQATPTITISTGGLITASATQDAGLVSAGTKRSPGYEIEEKQSATGLEFK